MASSSISFSNLVVPRKAEDSLKSGVGVVVVESGLYVVENGEVLKKTDVLERTGDTGFVDVGSGTFPVRFAGRLRGSFLYPACKRLSEG